MLTNVLYLVYVTPFTMPVGAQSSCSTAAEMENQKQVGVSVITNTPSKSMCIREGCTHPAVNNAQWQEEYCSQECVVSHCSKVFADWVKSNANSESCQENK